MILPPLPEPPELFRSYPTRWDRLVKHLFIPGKLRFNGKEVDCKLMLDTGGTGSSIDIEFAKRHGVPALVGQVNNAFNSAGQVDSQMYKLDVKLGPIGWFSDVEVGSYEHLEHMADFIFGMDIIQHLHVYITNHQVTTLNLIYPAIDLTSIAG